MELEELGIDFLHITRGMPEGPKYNEIWKDGGFLHWARELKQVLKIPVMTPNVHDPNLAKQAVSEGWTDMVALGRPLMADPNYVTKVKENRAAEINRCQREMYCFIRVWLGLPGRCQVNPETGFEKYNPEYQIHRGFSGVDMLPSVLWKKHV